MLLNASNTTMPKQKYTKKHVKPKWSSEIAPFHAAMRAMRVVWINAGRPRGHDNPLYHDYKNAKRTHRNKLRFLYNELDRQFFFSVLDKSADTDQTLSGTL